MDAHICKVHIFLKGWKFTTKSSTFQQSKWTSRAEVSWRTGTDHLLDNHELPRGRGWFASLIDSNGAKWLIVCLADWLHGLVVWLMWLSFPLSLSLPLMDWSLEGLICPGWLSQDSMNSIDFHGLFGHLGFQWVQPQSMSGIALIEENAVC